jgi:class 3 adenylate cyclase/tetratricopeptide (TPR) repeat protein
VTTENLAILFSDVVGSTELSVAMSPEAADEVRRGYFSVLRQAAAATGGHEVKGLGDGIMVTFASASAALACAVAMQQGVECDYRDRSYSVGLRIGLSGGEVTADDGDYYGDCVIEAARLCGICEGGQILSAAVVPLMAGRRNRHVCRSVGVMTLKGLPDPVDTVEVMWEPLVTTEAGGAVPLQPRLTVRPAVGMVGREGETSLLAAAYKRVASGEGREIIFVSGEAGLGKTTLVAEAARTAHRAGASVLFGHAEEDMATPYQLFAESLGHYVNNVEDQQLRRHTDAHGAELTRLIPALRSRVAEVPQPKATDSDTERYLLFTAVVEFLAEASIDDPVMLIFDDIQWADAGSLLLLRHLAATELPMRVLLVATMRDHELPNAKELRDTVGELWRQRSVSRMELEGLNHGDVLSYMEAMAGHKLGEDGVALAHAVHRETDGNPFFLSEVLRFLAETGAIFQDAAGQWTASESLGPLALPDSVREVIGGRVARLGDRAERSLSVAAVIGRRFDFDLLTRATRFPEEEVLEILEAATAAALVREVAGPPGHYTFAHALIRHTIYESLGPTRRARAHRQVAEGLEDICGSHPGPRVGELARHWLNATGGSASGRAIRYARQAGDAALSALAPADALRYFTQANELLEQVDDPDPVLALDLIIGLGTAQRQTGDPAFRDTLLEAARRAAEFGDTERLVAAALANNRGFYSAVGATDSAKVEVLETALGDLPEHDPERALVLATLCSELTHGSPLDRRQALAGEAESIAIRSGDDTTCVRVLNHLYIPLQVPQLLGPALTRTTDSLRRAERIGDPALLYWAAMWRYQTAARAADIDELERCLDIHGAMTEKLGQPMFAWGHAFLRGQRAFIAGDTAGAEALAAEALQIGTDSGQPDASLIYGTQLIMVRGQRGTMNELIPLIEQMAADAPEISPWMFGSLLAKAHVEVDHTDAAIGQLEAFAAAGFDLRMDHVWLSGMVDYADAAVVCGDPTYASPLFDRLAPWHAQLPATGASALPPVSHYLGGLAGVLGRYDEADAYFSQAAAVSKKLGAKFFSSRTDLWWGNVLVKRDRPGDADAARARLTSAQRVARDHGYGDVERRATEALGALGPSGAFGALGG